MNEIVSSSRIPEILESKIKEGGLNTKKIIPPTIHF